MKSPDDIAKYYDETADTKAVIEEIEFCGKHHGALAAVDYTRQVFKLLEDNNREDEAKTLAKAIHKATPIDYRPAEHSSLTVADLIEKLQRCDQEQLVFFREPYDEADEIGINDVESDKDGVYLS